jgi:serine/threonine protein kinase
MELHEKHRDFVPMPAQQADFGKYLLIGSIGKGGMAEVYLARPRAQRRLVAIKVIRASLVKQKQYVDMFMLEGTLAVQLNHESIVKTYEIGRIQGRHFICMEYISGVDLSLLLKRLRGSDVRRLPVPHALYVALRAAEGLHYAHELRDPKTAALLNVVNRDVSPSNVRISFDGDVKLLDFGIAKATSGLSSEIGVLKGKVTHMSPEQVRGLPLDRRSDVFSLGIVLHEMLTQEKLFRGDSEFQLMDIVRRAEVRPPSAVNPRVPGDLDAIVLRALQKDPADRFQTAEELALPLRETLARYNFNKSELRDLVRELCHEEWQRAQEFIEEGLSRDAPARRPRTGSDEDYGEFVEIYEEAAQEARDITSDLASRRRVPLWVWPLLAVAVLAVAAAAVLLLR